MVFSCSHSESVFSYNLLNDLSLYSVSLLCSTFGSNADLDLGIEDPKLVLIIGCIGLGLNIISVLFLHG